MLRESLIISFVILVTVMLAVSAYGQWSDTDQSNITINSNGSNDSISASLSANYSFASENYFALYASRTSNEDVNLHQLVAAKLSLEKNFGLIYVNAYVYGEHDSQKASKEARVGILGKAILTEHLHLAGGNWVRNQSDLTEFLSPDESETQEGVDIGWEGVIGFDLGSFETHISIRPQISGEFLESKFTANYGHSIGEIYEGIPTVINGTLIADYVSNAEERGLNRTNWHWSVGLGFIF